VALDVFRVGGLQRLSGGIAKGEAFFLLDALFVNDGFALGVGRAAGVMEVFGRFGIRALATCWLI